MRNYIVSLICLLSIISFGCNGAANNVDVDKQDIALSLVAKDLEMQIHWDPIHNCARLENEENFVVIYPNTDKIRIDEKIQKMESPALLKDDGEIYISLSFYRNHLEELKKQQTPFKPQRTNKVVRPLVKKSKRFRITLDAGHGGKDPGAIGNGLKEKDLNLIIVNYIAEFLKKDIEIVWTRNDDTYIPLSGRVDIANTTDTLVSVHFNSATPQAEGFEIWVYKAKNKQNQDKSEKTRHQQSKKLAQKIQKFVEAGTPSRWRGIRNAGFKVIKDTTIPAVLIECGFVTNKKEMEWFAPEENKKEMARLIAKGIRSYVNSFPK